MRHAIFGGVAGIVVVLAGADPTVDPYKYVALTVALAIAHFVTGEAR